MSLFTAQLHPGRALGFLALGASLHDVLTRLKAEPQRFPKLDLSYSPTNPVREPVVLGLPANGIRLRFDGPEQRLRLIEILDFTKNHIIFKEHNKDRDLVKPTSDPSASSGGPTFRHIYSRFLGPTYDGEYIPGTADDEDGEDEDDEGRHRRRPRTEGTYVLSYPGVAFTFPMPASAYSPDKDVVSLLSTPGSLAAVSMAVFSGDSWAQAREHLWTEVLPPIRTFPPLAKGRDASPDEISLVRIHGAGRLQLFRRWTASSFAVSLGETTPQELVAELGPPDAIYRKSDQRMYIHKIRTASSSRTRPGGIGGGGGGAGSAGSGSGGGVSRIGGGSGSGRNGGDPLHRRQDDHLTDTDQSSVPTASEEDEDEDEDDAAIEDEFTGNVTGECFFNYFYLGFDVLVSTPEPPSRQPPSKARGGGGGGESAGWDEAASGAGENGGGNSGGGRPFTTAAPDRLVATKVVLHGNVPGSYPFNRHRRCRWHIAYLGGGEGEGGGERGGEGDEDSASLTPAVEIDSEAPFPLIEAALHDEWKSIYASDEEARQRQRGMVLNRGWGDSPGSSIELLGGWEGHKSGTMRGVKGAEDSTTTLYGFPGLVFEVLKNGFVGALTVF